jgi:hypothetical protein
MAVRLDEHRDRRDHKHCPCEHLAHARQPYVLARIVANAAGSLGRSASAPAVSAAASIVAPGVSLIHRDSHRNAQAL